MSSNISGSSGENTGKMFKRIFLDTNPIIYFLENEQPYASVVREFLADAIMDEAEFYTSTITDAEYLVRPYKTTDVEGIASYRSFLRNLNVLKCFVTEQIAEESAKIRARYPGIKLGDSIQLATSIDCGCNCFYTNDYQLKQVTEANVIYMGE